MNKENKLEGIKSTFLRNIFAGDRVLWIIIASLAVISLLVIYSSTASMAYRKAGGDTAFYFFRQVRSMFIGFGAIAFIQIVKITKYESWSWVLYFLSMAVLGLTFVVGVNYNDASRWVEIPIIGMTIQPSDFVRITLVMVMAKALSDRQKYIANIPITPLITYKARIKSKISNNEILMRYSIPLLLPLAASCAVILMSNFSTSAITFLTGFLVLYIGGVKSAELRKLFLMVFSAAIVLLSVMYAFDIGRSKTVFSRLETFVGLSEEQNTEGSSDASMDDYQSEQARIAVASGGLLGKGPGNSTQRANLPHSYSDFAFAFIIEEYGLWGAAIVLVLFLWIFFRSIHISRRCSDDFMRILVLGLGLLIVIQALFNIMVSVQILPVTGQTLPFISLGGSSMLSSCVAIGIILGVSRHLNIKEQMEQRKYENVE